jgi:phosphocarrier protein HPr
MPQRTVVVGPKLGLHARPAALFVMAASAAQPIAVTIGRPGEVPVPANSILSVLALDAKGGQTVVLSAEGEGADAALDALAELVARDPDGEG